MNNEDFLRSLGRLTPEEVASSTKASEWADRFNRLTPEEIAAGMERCPTDALEFGVRFEALAHTGPAPAETIKVSTEYEQLKSAGLSDHNITMLRATGATHAAILHWAKDHPAATIEPAHGVEDIAWNASAEGYQLTCMCGWNSGSSKYLERIGQEYDSHMREEGILKP